MMSKPNGQRTEAAWRQLKADVPLNATSKEEPGFHGDLWMGKKDKSSSEQSTLFET